MTTVKRSKTGAGNISFHDNFFVILGPDTGITRCDQLKTYYKNINIYFDFMRALKRQLTAGLNSLLDTISWYA